MLFVLFAEFLYINLLNMTSFKNTKIAYTMPKSYVGHFILTC